MRKLLVSLIALVGLSVSGLAFANGDGLGIQGSPHDFSDNVCGGIADGTDLNTIDPVTYPTPGTDFSVCQETGGTAWNYRAEICRTCHVPHDHNRTNTFLNQGVLWNHDISTGLTWQPYASPTLEVPLGQDPDGMALACLGCHDGNSAIDAFDSHAVANSGTPTLGVALDVEYDAGFTVGFGTGDLRQNNPLSVVYVDGVGTGMNDVTADFDIANGTTIQDILDGSDKVQCSSCHDVHNATSVADTHLLRLPTKDLTGTGADASKLCLACHDK